MNKRYNWLVSVYVGEEIVEAWMIEDRTEREAETEAHAEVNKLTVEWDDWSITRIDDWNAP